jgi:hypothetical protein
MALITVKEAMVKLKCSKMAVHRLLGKGHIKGRSLPCVGVRIDEASVDEFIQMPTTAPEPNPRPRRGTSRQGSRVHFDWLQ